MMKYSFSSAGFVSVILFFALVRATNCYSPGETQDNNRYLNRLNLLEERIKQLRIRSEIFSKIRTESIINEIELTKKEHRQSGKKFHIPGTAYESQDMDSWAKLQISPEEFATVTYDDFKINVYQHSGNGRIINSNQTSGSRKFYYAPLAILDAWSARCFKNEITEQIEMEFSIELWNDDIQTLVKKNVTKILNEDKGLNITVKDTSIQIIPFKELILTSSWSNFKKKLKFTADTWVPYQQGKKVKFSLICESLERCEKIAQGMKREPSTFAWLRLHFRVDSEKAKTEQINIKIDTIMRGELMSKLTQKMPGAEIVLLRENDAQQMLSESAANIIYDKFRDSDNSVVKPAENSQLMSFLKDNIIEAQKTMIENQNDTRWGNVFWNADNYRPDKLTHSFQENFKNLNTTNKKDLVDAFSNLDKFNIDTSINVPAALLDVKLKTDTEHGLAENSTKGSIDKFLKESRDKVMWDGAKFVPKPMSFSRMNMDNIKKGTKLTNTQVTIKYSTSTLLVEVNIPTVKQLVPPNQLVQMQKQVEEITAEMNSGVAKLNSFKVDIIQTGEDVLNQVQTVENLHQAIQEKMQKSTETLSNGLTATRKPAFDAYRITGFSNVGETITYDGVMVDVFSNLNPTQGIFTVPIDGIYEITFHGLSGSVVTTVRLVVNGKPITQANGAEGTPHQMALSTILPLKANDEVACQLYNGMIYGDDDHSLIFTHFTGQLLYSSTGGNFTRIIVP